MDGPGVFMLDNKSIKRRWRHGNCMHVHYRFNSTTASPGSLASMALVGNGLSGKASTNISRQCIAEGSIRSNQLKAYLFLAACQATVIQLSGCSRPAVYMPFT